MTSEQQLALTLHRLLVEVAPPVPAVELLRRAAERNSPILADRVRHAVNEVLALAEVTAESRQRIRDLLATTR